MRKWTAEDIQIVSGLQAVCRNPLWYTMHGTLGEVVAFLDGCYFLAASPGHRGWKEFLLWLVTRLECDEKMHWGACLHQAFPEDAEAIKQLAVLEAEYKARSQSE